MSPQHKKATGWQRTKTTGTGDTADATFGQRDEKKQTARMMTKTESARYVWGEFPNNSAGETGKRAIWGWTEAISGSGEGGAGAQDAVSALEGLEDLAASRMGSTRTPLLLQRTILQPRNKHIYTVCFPAPKNLKPVLLMWLKTWNSLKR